MPKVYIAVAKFFPLFDGVAAQVYVDGVNWGIGGYSGLDDVGTKDGERIGFCGSIECAARFETLDEAYGARSIFNRTVSGPPSFVPAVLEIWETTDADIDGVDFEKYANRLREVVNSRGIDIESVNGQKL